jgi:protein HIRA/HIR1
MWDTLRTPLLNMAAGAIFAVDVHPSGTRLATCGMDHKVNVWDTRPVLDARYEQDPGTPRLLACLAEHATAVNVVRFSHNGQRLASANSDGIVLVHELRQGAGGPAFGSRIAPSVENWKLVHSMSGGAARGQAGSDIADLAWAPRVRTHCKAKARLSLDGLFARVTTHVLRGCHYTA